MQDEDYWKTRRAHSEILVSLLALPIAFFFGFGIWYAYLWVHEGGEIVSNVILVFVNGSASVAIVGYDCFNTGMNICPQATGPMLGGALFSLIIFGCAAWSLEYRTKRKIFYWYAILIAVYELNQNLICRTDIFGSNACDWIGKLVLFGFFLVTLFVVLGYLKRK
ncbi:MAG: hypothetical protein WCT31_02480 [Candidatus Micrarchaeia archaeon]|jgi:hypothetical protein